MRNGPLISTMASGASRWARLVPGLLRHDPLFRYAAIAALLAAFFLGARLAQDFAGPGAIPPVGLDDVDKNAANAGDGSAAVDEPPRPGSTAKPPASADAARSAIAPGRSLNNIRVEPAAPDRFGTLPQGDNTE